MPRNSAAAAETEVEQGGESTESTETVATVMTQSITVQGLVFNVPAPYAEGHTLTTAEAAVLNQTFGENLRNNFAARVRSAKEAQIKAQGLAEDTDLKTITLDEQTLETLKGEFAEYAAGYSFSGKRQTRTPVDPVLREATKIAREMITSSLAKRTPPVKVKDLPDGKMDELVRNLLSKRPDITEEAKRRVDAVKAVAEAAMDDLGIDESVS